jgi:hypothetical protein
MKAIFNFALRLHDRFKAFVTKFNREFDGAEKGNQTAEKIDELVKKINEESPRPELPWFYAFYYTEGFKMEKEEWEEKKRQFPSFYTMVKAVRSEMNRGFFSSCSKFQGYPLLLVICVFFIRISSWVPVFQIILSRVGTQYWKRVSINYCVFLTVSLGVWTDYVAGTFKVVDKYTNFFQSYVDDEDDDNKLIKAYEKKNQFMEFFSAFVNARTVLLQLIPGSIIISTDKLIIYT